MTSTDPRQVLDEARAEARHVQDLAQDAVNGYLRALQLREMDAHLKDRARRAIQQSLDHLSAIKVSD